ncbi:AfsR/SARP family transcriptional regulator [Pseudarthrobacter albicanus]|uniref:AfsR/SARP family transcriptional regulator n=1 Tax=Pseudarthrobacter albicanus TaxID=2823873 RepID=UPI0027DDCCC2|nr:BTAD domain-containing putative transcriptional regulator [Pseudarthrobacter albicanus]
MENPTGATPTIAVRLFGAFEVRRNGLALTAADMGGCKPRHILEILLLNLGTPVSKTRLIEILWGPGASDGAVATLESYVSGIRRAIQPGQTKTGPLRTANSGYVLDPQLVDLDLANFRRLVHAAGESEPATAHRLLLEALEISAEPLLGFELASEWAEEARTHHAAEKVTAQIFAAETAGLLDKPDVAVNLAQAAIRSEPLNERAWTVLVTAYEQAGLPVEGLSAYDRCRRLFDRDLGCAPGPALQEAHLRLLRQRAEGNSELSEVLAALLYLGERLNGPKGRQLPAGESRRMHENAGRVLDSFLQRVRAAV